MNLQRVEQIGRDSVLNVLQYAVGPSETSLKEAVLFYQGKKGRLYKYEEKACIGIEVIGATKARICHIAVAPQYRHKGIALQMIKKVVTMHQLTYVEAETDNEAVEFYPALTGRSPPQNSAEAKKLGGGRAAHKSPIGEG